MGKQGRPWPTWALTLKTGRYTVDQLVKISGAKKNTIRKFMANNCVRIIDSRDSMTNKQIVIYEWENNQN